MPVPDPIGASTAVALTDLQERAAQTASNGRYQTPGIVEGPGNWFSPLNPLAPVAPIDVQGRQFDYQAGYNVQLTPKAFEGIGFPYLRSLSRACTILREVIETRKDQMEKLTWAIKPRMSAQGEQATGADDPYVQQITDFLKCPDRENDIEFSTWLRLLLEDTFVCDAPTLYVHRDRGGKLLGLEVVDGATIMPRVTNMGRRPAPPLPAYQQILKGMPAVDYTAAWEKPNANGLGQLLYFPRNPSADRVYGLGPVEQIIMTVTTALLKEVTQLDYYTDSNIPRAVIGVPPDWDKDRLAKYQAYWDNLLTGNLAMRQRGILVPGDVAKNFRLLKEPDLTGKFDEWLARVICYAFSVSPQPFVSQVNRATAGTAAEQAEEEGLQPLMGFVKRVIDACIRKFWPQAKVEFAWNDDEQTDKVAQANIIKTKLQTGEMSLNEARDIDGMDPIEGGDAYRVFVPAIGYVRIDANDDAPTAGEQAQQKADSAKAMAEAKAKQPQLAPGQAAAPATQASAQEGAPAAKGARATFRKGKKPDFWKVSPRRDDARHGLDANAGGEHAA